MKKKWKIAAIAMSAVLCAGACSAKPPLNDGEERVETVNKTEENTDGHQSNLDAIQPMAYGNVEGLNLEPGTYLSIIGKSADGEYWSAIKEGAEKAVEDINTMLGYKGADKVKVVYSGPGSEGDVDEQVNILDEELARYPAALAIAIIDSKSCDVQFDLAAENNIPIVTFDSASNYQGIMARVSTDNTAAAKTAASRTAEAMKEEGKIIVLVHDSKSQTSLERSDVFAGEIKANHPKVSISGTYYLDKFDDLKKEIAAEIEAGTYTLEEAAQEEDTREEDTREETEVVAEDITDEQTLDYIFAKNPDASAVYATNGEAVMTALETTERLEKKDMVITGFDANEAEVEALKDGKIAGVVMQNPYGMGYAAIVAEARSVLEMGNEAAVDTGYTWVTQKMAEKQDIQY